MRRRPALTPWAWFSIALAFTSILAISTFLAVSHVVIPRILDAVENRVSSQSDWVLTVGDARFVPFKGVVVQDLVVRSSNQPGEIHVDTITSRPRLKNIAALLRRDKRSFTPTEDSPIEDAYGYLTHLVDENLLPDSIWFRDLTIANGPSKATNRLLVPTIKLEHDEDQAQVNLQAAVSTPLSITSEAEIRYLSHFAVASVAVGAEASAVLPAESGNIDGNLSLEVTDGRRVDFDGVVRIDGLALRAPTVASEPITGVSTAYTLRGAIHPNWARDGSLYEQLLTGRLLVENGTLEVNGVALQVTPKWHGGDKSSPEAAKKPTIDVGVVLPDTPVQRLVEAFPTTLLGPLGDLKATGTLAWRLQLQVPVDAIGESTWEATTKLSGFSVTRIGAEVDPYQLTGRFNHIIEDAAIGYHRVIEIPPPQSTDMRWMLTHTEHTEAQIRHWRTEKRNGSELPERVGPDPAAHLAPDRSYRFIRLEAMSPWIPRAVLTAEDGDFFFHDGVNFLTLMDAIERNVREGEIVLGASTISMQLVKMLFLDQRRTFARKLQEAFLVYVMEEEVPVPKERILEIYLNVAEFGPAVYGIYDAAQHYFSKNPSELGAGEATWLASILPAPKRYYHYYEQGAISDGWFERMKSYYDIMLERGRMTSEEHRRASTAPPAFVRTTTSTSFGKQP